MLHHGTPSTPNQAPNSLRFEPAGFSVAPRCFSASARAPCPSGLPTCGGGGAVLGFAAVSALRVFAPTTPSTASLFAFWNA